MQKSKEQMETVVKVCQGKGGQRNANTKRKRCIFSRNNWREWKALSNKFKKDSGQNQGKTLLPL